MDSEIPPLTKRDKNDVPYARPGKVEARIKELVASPIELFAEQVSIDDPENPEYVPSEAIVHLLRWQKIPEKHPAYRTVWQTLMGRVLTQIGCATAPEAPLSPREDIVRNQVVDTLVDRLVSNHYSPNESLDFFEARFGSAVKALKIDAERKYQRENGRRAPLEIDQDSGEISTEAEKGAGSFDPVAPNKLDDPDYRSRLDAAIDLLEPMQRQIIHMLRFGDPIESQRPDVRTISTTLQRTPKTIRSQRDKAFIRLRELLAEE